MGHRPTGQPVTYDEIFIFRFAGRRIAETWGVVDVVAQMKQLGVIPATPDQPTTSRPARPDDNRNQGDSDEHHQPSPRRGDQADGGLTRSARESSSAPGTFGAC